MNLSQTPSDVPGAPLYLAFNQDASYLAVGMRSGYSVFSLEPFGECFCSREGLGGVGILEMLFSTTLAAFVGAGIDPSFSPRKLVVYNVKEKSVICDISYLSSVLNVKLNHARMVVVLNTTLYIYDMKTMKSLSVLETTSNHRGLCAISTAASSYILAYPSSSTLGTVLLYDMETQQPLHAIDAHNGQLVCLALSQDGTLLATASITGTIIRVFSVADGKCVGMYRRGTTSSEITSLSFSPHGDVVAAASANGTVHVFKIVIQKEEPVEPSRFSIRSLIPSQLSNLVETPRADWKISLPLQKGALVAFRSEQLLVSAQADGSVLSFRLLPDGETRLDAEKNLNDYSARIS